MSKHSEQLLAQVEAEVIRLQSHGWLPDEIGLALRNLLAEAKPPEPPTVIVTVNHDAWADVVNVPPGLHVVVRDYNITNCDARFVKTDAEGRKYLESVWTESGYTYTFA